LQAYVDSVCTILDAQSEPVILVGHSMGGAAITQASHFTVLVRSYVTESNVAVLA